MNVFMNIRWTATGTLSFDPSVSALGRCISLRVEMDMVITFSACPQGIMPINRLAGKPTEANFEIA